MSNKLTDVEAPSMTTSLRPLRDRLAAALIFLQLAARLILDRITGR